MAMIQLLQRVFHPQRDACEEEPAKYRERKKKLKICACCLLHWFTVFTAHAHYIFALYFTNSTHTFAHSAFSLGGRTETCLLFDIPSYNLHFAMTHNSARILALNFCIISHCLWLNSSGELEQKWLSHFEAQNAARL